jgi:hypothetical protein
LVGWLSGVRAQTGCNARATADRRLGEAAAPGEGSAGRATTLHYTLAFALQLKRITENLSQGSRKVLGCSAPNTIRLVELAIAGDGLGDGGPCGQELYVDGGQLLVCRCLGNRSAKMRRVIRWSCRRVSSSWAAECPE